MKPANGIGIVLVVKASKLCNLRCTYCYETPELANRARMSVEDITKMFSSLRAFFKSGGHDYDKCRLQFIWHGGEPFAQPVAYWESIIAAQKKVFGARFQKRSILNDLQTNLTLVTDKHLPLLKENFGIGFSYDVENSLRVNMAGKPTGELVRRKVEWAQSKGVSMGAIAVISRANVGYPEIIADYFLSRGIGFRALNIYEHVDMLQQIRDASVPFDDFMAFCLRLYAMPQVREHLAANTLFIDPLYTAYGMLQFWRQNRKNKYTLKECVEREWALGVNTNGDTYGIGDMYEPEYRYGNIFKEDVSQMLASEGRTKRMTRSKERMEKICSSCFLYRKGCAGTFVGHASPESYRNYEQAGSCEMGLLAGEMRRNPPENYVEVGQPVVNPASSSLTIFESETGTNGDASCSAAQGFTV